MGTKNRKPKLVAQSGNPPPDLTAPDQKQVLESEVTSLLDERARLEKETIALEQKLERGTTQKALLQKQGHKTGSLFAKQPNGDYKYIGKNHCCLNSSPHEGPSLAATKRSEKGCHHEICGRAKETGISWTEMETIRYTELRINAEKSDRVKKALRKQLEVELIRIKKVEDEEASTRARKAASLDKADREALRRTCEQNALLKGGGTSVDYQRDAVLEAAKQNDTELTRIRDDLEKIKGQVDAGTVTSDKLRIQLDAAQAKMGEAERRNNLFRQLIVETEKVNTQCDSTSTLQSNLDDDLQKLCATAENAVSQAMNILKDFFSASEPDQMEDTMNRLRSSLEARGPMPRNMRDSFKELEKVVNESKSRGMKMDFKVDCGGTISGRSMTETMLALRAKLKDNPTGAIVGENGHELDKELIKANRECLVIEEAAEQQLIAVASKLADDTTSALEKALEKIKCDAIVKSPIPPLSDIMLDTKIQTLLDLHGCTLLLKDYDAGMSDHQLDARFTSMVVAKAEKKPEKFSAALRAIEASLNLLTDCDIPKDMADSLEKVSSSMRAWAKKHAEAKEKASGSRTPAQIKKDSMLDDRAWNEMPRGKIDELHAKESNEKRIYEAKIHLFEVLATMTPQQPTEEFRAKLPQVLKNVLLVSARLTPWVLDNFRHAFLGTAPSAIDTNPQQDAKWFDVEYDTHDLLAIHSFIGTLHSQSYCATKTTVSLSFALAETFEKDRKKGEADLKRLKDLIKKTQREGFDKAWYKQFILLTGTMLEIHASISGYMCHIFGAGNIAAETAAWMTKWLMTMVFLIEDEIVSTFAPRCLQVLFRGLSTTGKDVPKDLTDKLKLIERIRLEGKLECRPGTCLCRNVKAVTASNQKVESHANEPPLVPIVKSINAHTTHLQDIAKELNCKLDKIKDQSHLVHTENAIEPGTTSHTVKKTIPVAMKATVLHRPQRRWLQQQGSDAQRNVIDRIERTMVETSLRKAYLHAQAFQAAHLDLPLNLVIAIDRLEACLKDWEKLGRRLQGDIVHDVAKFQDYEHDNEVLLCDCQDCVESYRQRGLSNFGEHAAIDPVPAQRHDLSEPNTQEHDLHVWKTSMHHIASTLAGRKYLDFVAGKESDEQECALEERTGNAGHSKEVFSVSPSKPDVSITCLETSRSAYECLDNTAKDIGSFLRQLVDSEDTLFVTGKEWHCRKLQIHPSELLSDYDLHRHILYSCMSGCHGDEMDYTKCVQSIVHHYHEEGVAFAADVEKACIAPSIYGGDIHPDNLATLVQAVCARLPLSCTTVPLALLQLTSNAKPSDSLVPPGMRDMTTFLREQLALLAVVPISPPVLGSVSEKGLLSLCECTHMSLTLAKHQLKCMSEGLAKLDISCDVSGINAKLEENWVQIKGTGAAIAETGNWDRAKDILSRLTDGIPSITVTE